MSDKILTSMDLRSAHKATDSLYETSKAMAGRSFYNSLIISINELKSKNMKQLYVLLIAILLAFSSFSQPIDHISFTYDDAGNRESREVIYLKTGEVEEAEATNQTAFGQVMDSVEFKSTLGTKEITIFPNPTKGSLTIAMAGAQETGPATLVLFSLKGEVILQRK